MNLFIRAKIRPFKHDNRIQLILGQIHQINVKNNVSQLKDVHFLPAHKVMPLHPSYPRLWKYFKDTAGRVESSEFAKRVEA